MARRDDLIAFAQLHGLKIATISDLIAYRRHYDELVERTLETEFKSRFGGDFHLAVYRTKVGYGEHVALWKGDLGGAEPALVRVHALNLLDDVLGDSTSGKSGELQAALEMIGEAGRGVVVLIREPVPTSLSDRLTARGGEDPSDVNELRDIGVGAHILWDLGVRNMILLSNAQHTYVGLEGYGLSVKECRPIGKPQAG
jgi:3,4-dihydroxy 2-butanone 4-phosphate synthase/GTP cyclohydrolase II